MSSELLKVRNKKCEECNLHKSATTVCIRGRGNSSANIMIVGEATNISEDESGGAFRSRPGKLVTETLSDNGIEEKDIYLTHAVKCRPPEKNPPSAKEISTCSRYLQEEIEIVKPKYVLLLGATALKAALRKAGITKIHGDVIEKDGIKYFPVFHPNYVLRNPHYKSIFESDIDKFRRMTKGEEFNSEPELDIRVVTTLKELKRYKRDIINSKVVSFDTETTGLEPHEMESQINSIGIGCKDKQIILPVGIEKFKISSKMQYAIVDYLNRIVKKYKIKTTAHNGKFDKKWILYHYDVNFKLSFDTILASHILDENIPANLTYQSKLHFNAPSYDIPLKEKTHPTDIDGHIKYLALDVFYSRKLYFLFKRRLKRDPPSYMVFREVSMGASEAYLQAEMNGAYIHKKKFKKVEKDLVKDIARCEKILNSYAKKPDVNWNSPDQVSEVLFNELKLKVINKTPKGKPSTAEPALLRMRSAHKIVQVLLDHRGYQKLYSSFIKGWTKRMYGNYLYPKYKITGAVTGRPSCENPNLQQVPRESSIRTLIGAPDGWTNYEADYSQVELRVTAIVSGERTMLNIFKTGGDMHTTTAIALTGKSEVTKAERKSAKAVNFGFIYGMGFNTFTGYAYDKYGVTLSDTESKGYRRRFFEKYSGLPDWHSRCRKRVKAHGFVRTLTGRMRHLPEIYSPDSGVRAQAERNAINSPVQGFAAELTLMAFIEIVKTFSNKIVQVYGTVHDAILFRVKNGYEDIVIPKIKKIMIRPKILDKFGIDFPIPIEIEVNKGPWGGGVVV